MGIWRRLVGGLMVVGALGATLARGQGEGRIAPGGGSGAEASGEAAGAKATTHAVDPAKMDWLLEQWEKQSARLKTLDVTIFRVDDTPTWNEIEYYEGRALFQSPNLAFIDFHKIQQDENKRPLKDPKTGKYLSTPYERIVCTGAEVWQYRSDTQQIFIFPLEKDEQAKALEEGPLPFLFNMKADEVRQRYQLTLMSEDAKSYGVSIKPKLEVDRESFSLAFVRLDRKYLLPVRIVMLSPDGKSKKDFQLGPMYPNKAINEKNFEGKPLGPPWKIVRNPAGEDRPRGGVTRTPPRQNADPAAARPQAAESSRRR
jgi:TIGR03009 family protein